MHLYIGNKKGQLLCNCPFFKMVYDCCDIKQYPTYTALCVFYYRLLSVVSEVVTTDQMGGSIKKAQVGHVIISVAKSLQQKEMNLATIAITKSRIGKDGVVFENCKYDNEMLVIDTEQSMTFLGLEEQKEEKQRDRIKELMEKRKQRENI
jgi:hypothetical protein